jgi:hypothetical protein
MSENAIGYLLNRAGYHGHHVPHGFRAAFATIMNEWAERHGKDHNRKVIDLMLAHVPKEKVEGAYNRAAYMARRRELAQLWADMLSDGLPDPGVLIERPVKAIGTGARQSVAPPVEAEFRFRPDAELHRETAGLGPAVKSAASLSEDEGIPAQKSLIAGRLSG